ncbi:MAG: PAS domain-containing protein [Methylococcaceae bacterium]
MLSDTAPRPPPSKSVSRGGILSVVLVYAIFAAAWILLSDKLVQMIFSNPHQIILVSMLKGWLFVAITSLLLYGLMQRWIGDAATAKTAPAGSRRLRVSLLLLTATIIALTAISILHTFMREKEDAVGRIQAIAELKAWQIADWLKDRQSDADSVQTSQFFTEQYRRWQESGDPHSAKQLQMQLEQLRQNRGFDAVLVLDSSANKLWESDSAPLTLTPALQAEAQLAAAQRKTRQLGPYHDASGKLYLDFITPLTAIPGPAALVVLHLDLGARLPPLLQTGFAPGASSETLLFQRNGGRLIRLNELKHPKDGTRAAVATEKLFATQVLRAEASPDHPIEGLDDRGAQVIGVIRAISGTDWLLATKQDLSEFYAEAVGDMTWVGLVGLLAVFITGAGFYLLLQNQQLALAQAVQQSQAERLRALSLLAAVADSSDDAIFAKDREGCYILFNRAAGLFIGRSAEEVVGRDDRAIFPPAQAEMLMAFDRRVIAESRTIIQEEELDTLQGQRVFLATKGPLRDNEGKVIGIFGISRDITDSKQTEAALQASELSYRSLFENMMNSVVHARIIFQGETPVDLEYLSANPAFATVTGIAEPVIGRKVSEVIPGYCENNPESIEIFGRVATTGVSTRWEHYLRELNRWFSFMIYSPSYGEVIIVTENITERKTAEAQLCASEERLKLALDVTNDGLWDWDLRSGLSYLTPHYYEMTGYRRDQVTPDFEFFKRTVHPDDLPHVLETMSVHLQGKTSASEFDYRLITPSGKTKWIRGKGQVVERDASGAPLRMIGTITDISARKAAEEALRQHEQYQRAVLDNFPFMVWLKDIDSRILAANRAYAQVANVANPDEMIGKTDFDYWDKELAERYRADDRAVLENGRPKMVEEEITEAGRRFWIESYKSPVKLDGRIIGTVGFAREITERKAAEAELRRRNDELERFNRATVGRELDMIALKQQVNEFARRLGQEPIYPLAFLDTLPVQPKQP